MNTKSSIGLTVIGLLVGLAGMGCKAGMESPASAVTGTIATSATPEASPPPTATQPSGAQRAEDFEAQTIPVTPSTRVPNAPAPTATNQPLITDGGALPVGAIARMGIGHIRDSAISTDDSLLALGTSTGIYVYQVDGFERVWRKYTAYPVETVSFSPDGSRLLTGFGVESGPTLWEAQTGVKIRELDGWHGGTWSPDGSMIAIEIEPSVRPEDRASLPEDLSDVVYTTGLNLYESQNGSFISEALIEIPWYSFWMHVFKEIIWSVDGEILAANAYSTIHIWDIASGQLLNSLTATQEYETFQAFTLSPDGRQILAYASILEETKYKPFYLWDWQSGESASVLEFEQLEDGIFRKMVWSLDGTTVTLFSGNQIASLDIFQQQLTRQQTIAELPPFEKVEFSPDNRRAIMARRAIPLILDLPTGQIIAELPHQGEQIEWFHTLPYILIGDLTNAVIWDVQTQNEVFGLSGLVDVEYLAWLPDSQTVAWFGGGEFWAYDITTKIRKPISDYEFGQSLRDQFCTDYLESWECIAQDGSVAKAGWQSVGIFDPEGVLLQNVDTGELRPGSLGWSPASNLLAIGAMKNGCGDGPFGGGCFNTDATLMVWSSNHQRAIAQQSFGQTGITSFAWSPTDGTLAVGLGRTMYDDCASGLEGNEIVLIDPYTWQELYRFTGHSGNVTHLAFSLDGSKLASASADGTIIIWDVPN